MPKAITSKLLEVYEKEDRKKYAKLKVPFAAVMELHGIQAADNVTLLASGI